MENKREANGHEMLLVQKTAVDAKIDMIRRGIARTEKHETYFRILTTELGVLRDLELIPLNEYEEILKSVS